ncbi:MAG: bifunctional tRNA (5-methylaminomethyl-2-thiouridine)(34)-methyltransferase MnmD/FAD-dependent 5-carboxymethylaminomethyl-2-thiouridine(34) oxidoreductase MnmC [Alphaproteobacteria bacterium]|nr:bifunctional tRNA (5-methylaminomethyl-2-thiouridine)(34)-methyltransferase MnmD/FAD-dependent 5-carboxymethylaminomethyl-2-thiouridine(34) oxidoreductase MnmC [Alphaproteobacteria bacterium]
MPKYDILAPSSICEAPYILTLKPARLQWSDDGSLKSLDYDDVYFQLKGAGTGESEYVFLQNNDLAARFAALMPGESFRIGELGFGSGLNFMLAARLFDRAAPKGARLPFPSIEKHPIEKPDLARIHGFFGELAGYADALREQYPPLIEGFHGLRFSNGRIRLLLALGDVADMLPALQGKFDAWFLDGFSPKKNADMWGDALYDAIAARTARGGTLSSFSSAGHVRRGLAAAGFTVRKVPGYGIKWNMTAAQFGEKPAPADVKTYNVAVLGAGLAGCAVARALADRGQRVGVIDRAEGCAAGASGNPVGIMYPKLTVDPSPLGDYHSHAFCAARARLEELKPKHWKPCGVLRLDMNAEKQKRTRELLARRGYPEDFAHIVEDAAGTGRTALNHPAAGMVSPPAFCAALIDHEHVQKIYATTVTKLEKTAKGWMICDAEGEPVIIADAVVVALAQESKDIDQLSWLPLQPLRGQMTLLKATEESKKLQTVICHDGYIAPAVDGLHSMGATFQKEDFSPAPETRGEDDLENLEKLNAALPQFGFTAKDVAGHRAGYRATTPDKLPLIGPAPDYEAFCKAHAGGKETPTDGPLYHEGLYVATGFGAHGTTGAVLAGEILAALITADPLPVPEGLMRHLLPERFILRALKRREA